MPRTMCFTSASGCSADSLMLLSFMRRTRAQSVLEVFEEDCRFTPGRLAKGNDVDAVPRFGVNDRHGHSFEKAQCHEALFRVVKPIVLVGERETLEYPFRVHEVEAMILQVQLALDLMPRELHGLVYIHNVYTSTLQGLLRSNVVLRGGSALTVDLARRGWPVWNVPLLMKSGAGGRPSRQHPASRSAYQRLLSSSRVEYLQHLFRPRDLARVGVEPFVVHCVLDDRVEALARHVHFAQAARKAEL